MSQPAPRLPWQERWTKPTVEQLVEPLTDPQRKAFVGLLEQLDAMEGVQRHVVWHGRAWKWTLQFTLHDHAGELVDTLLFLVPKPDAPIACVPLRDETIEQIPLKRLNKYIRDGIKSAKTAVELNWAMWTPSAMTEVEYLTDLLKRKCKAMLLDPSDHDAAGNGQG